jgi:ABC-2 type transport system permease protein
VRRLLASELLQFRSRRLVVVLVATALAGSLVGAAIAASQSTRPTEAERAEAHAKAEREYRKCLEVEFEEGALPAPQEEFCREEMGDETRYLRSHLALVELPAILEGVSALMIVVGLVIGSSIVAASWQTGTIGTIFTWEPRRLRWFACRLLVVALGVAVCTIAILTILSLALAAAAALRGTTIVTEGWSTDVFATGSRIAGAAMAAAVIGGAVAAVGRHTAAALGVVFVWAAVIEGLVRGLQPGWSPWLLGENLVSFVGWQTLNVQVSQFESYTITPRHAAFVMVAYAAVIAAVGFVAVRVRDVQ